MSDGTSLLSIENQNGHSIQPTNPLKHDPQTSPSLHLAVSPYSHFGHDNDLHGHCQELQRPRSMPCDPWSLRSKFLSWCCLHRYIMVQKIRSPTKIRVILHHGCVFGLTGVHHREAPRHQTGYGTSLGFICLGLATSLGLELMLKMQNKKKGEYSAEEVMVNYTDEQLDTMSDKSPLYKYML